MCFLRQYGIAVVLLGLTAGGGRAAAVVLTFEDIPLQPDGFAVVTSPYVANGFSLASTSGFSARGPGSGSADFTPTPAGGGPVTTSLAAFAPATITLTQNEGILFALESIDLAREFRFNTPEVGQAFPEVTFTGLRSYGGTGGTGGTVTQTFVADQSDFSFRTFTFSSDFTNP